VSGGDESRSGWSSNLDDRPLLCGFLVDTEALGLNVDPEELVFEFGADHLKDVPVTLFVDRTPA